MKTKIKTKIIVSLISVIFFILIVSALPVKAMANPASEYCVGLGGTLEIRVQKDGGQYGVCIFSDGSECEEWALYNGECQKGLLINGDIRNENVEKQIVNTEEIQKIYNKLNKLSKQETNGNKNNENINEAKRMAEFDQKVNVSDLGVGKSKGFFGTVGAFLFSGTQDSETEQIGILPDSKLYPLKEISRKIRITFTFNPIKKVELQQRFANEKLLEAEKVYEKNKDPEQAEKLLEEYGKEAELIAERMGNIGETSKNQLGIDNLLDNLADHLIKRQKVVQELKEKLEKQLPSQSYEKVEANLDRTVEKLGLKIEQLEENRQSLKERFIKVVAEQEGSEFKNFKNLEILEEIEEKMPLESQETLKEAREKIREKLVQNISKMDAEKRMDFKNYVNEINGNAVRHLEIVKEIELEEIPPEVRVEIEKAKDKALQKIEGEMKTMKFENQRKKFLKVLKDPEIEKLRVIKELENKLPSKLLNEVKKIKEENIGLIQKKIENNSKEQEEFIEKAKEFHDVFQFEILEELGINVNEKVKQVIDKAVDRTYEEFENDIKRVESAKNKRTILEKLTTDQPNHIEVLNRVQEKLENKLPDQAKAPEVLERVIKMLKQKINNQIENAAKKTCKDLCGDGICQKTVCEAIGCPCAETAESCPKDCKEETKYNLDEYYSNIDYSCNTDSDCAIKDVRNCCGYYPKCVNKDTKVDPDYVRKACAVEKMVSICGFPSIDSCRCVQNKCEGFLKEGE